MSVQINYKTINSINTASNLVIFVDENFNISGYSKYIHKDEFSYISELLKTRDLKRDVLNFYINSKKKYF